MSAYRRPDGGYFGSVEEAYDYWLCRDDLDILPHLDLLRRYASITSRPILELGTRHGASTSALLLGAQQSGALIYSVDINPHCKDVFDGHPNWIFTASNSINPKLLSVIPESLGGLFIDTSHEYEQTFFELEMWLCRIIKNGWCILHDWKWDGNNAVRKATFDFLGSIRLDYVLREYLDDPFGLAVISNINLR